MEIAIVVVVVVGVIFAAGILAMMVTFMRRVDQGQALIVNTGGGKEPIVTFTGMVVKPVFHRAEVMDISLKSIQIARAGNEGLICADNIRADIKVAFFVRVNKTVDDVLRVAQNIGVKRASDQETLEDLFVAKFSEALKTVGKQMEFEHLYTQRDNFKQRILENIGTDLNGYVLDDAAIDYLEQTPLDALNPANILDAQGIRKITEITTRQNVQTDQLRQDERKTMTKQQVEADEAVMELERRRADAESKQKREIESMRAREGAETEKIKAEERTRSKLAQIKEEEQTQVAEFNKQRQTEVADKDRERVLAIKEQQVEKDREMEMIARQREVELSRIAMQKDVEIQKKEIADVVSTRIAVDKKVAEEEERIKDLRVHSEANRQKDVLVTAAEAQAQSGLVKEIKAAEANEKVAEFDARRVLTAAKAQLDAADKQASAMIRMSEGTQAEGAATGLAHAKVLEAEAQALEKRGMAEARVSFEKMGAEARGRDALVAVKEKEGTTEANVLRLKMVAEAEGTTEQGKATASAIQAKLLAEATGLKEKLLSMQKMEGAAKDHEEFRLRLENERTITLEALETQVKVAAEQSKVMGQAFENADIKIMGGDGQFFDQFVKAASLGNAIDGFMDHSKMAKEVAHQVTNGGGITGLLEGNGASNGHGNLEGLAAMLAAFAAKASDEDKQKLLQILDKKSPSAKGGPKGEGAR